MDAVKFLKEKERMCDSFNSYCDGCEIESQRCGIGCGVYMRKYPEQAVSVVEKWVAEHPQETRLTRLLKNYPNTPLNDDGIPVYICTSDLGLMDVDYCDDDCVSCWNTPIEEEGGVNV